jgi:hypothetical protein
MAANPINAYQPLSASALFTLNGNQLTIQVNNTAAPETQRYVDTDVLTGIYFGAQPFDLTPQSATSPKLVDASGATVCAGSCDVGAGWEYHALTLPDYGLLNGLSAVQSPVFLFGNFAVSGRPLGSTSYGIVSQTYPDNSGTQLNESPYSVGSATFVLNVPSSFTLTTIDRIVFAWGTSPNDPWGDARYSYFGDAGVAPEPSTWLLAAAAVAWVVRRASRAAERRRSE